MTAKDTRFSAQMSNMPNSIFNAITNQGSFTKGEGSVQLTSFY
jgi:hypothetical protein